MNKKLSNEKHTSLLHPTVSDEKEIDSVDTRLTSGEMGILCSYRYKTYVIVEPEQ